jgi:phosphohistidine phosphatase
MSFHLYIMRHAKSDWETGTSDFDRPINQRGNNSAIRIGQWMSENNYIPEKIISSSAVRAKQTIELLVDQIEEKDKKEISYEKDLYLASLDTLLENITLYKSNVNSLMLVAHNPGLEELVYFLDGDSGSQYISMTTANLVIYEYADNQFDVETDKGKRIEFIKPKELK